MFESGLRTFAPSHHRNINRHQRTFFYDWNPRHTRLFAIFRST